MKPTRGQPRSPWLKMWSDMPKQRRSSWLSLVAMLLMFFLLALYQRYETVNPAPIHLDRQELPGQSETAEPAAGTVAPEETVQVQIPPRTLLLPLAGEEVRGYAQVWSETFGDWRWHTGIDLRTPAGTPVKAAAAGQVTAVDEDPLDGLTVVIDHGNGLVTRYGGLQDPLVTKGARVTAGQLVGEVGAPGPAEAEMGPHLHFEVLDGGEPVDPMTFIR